MKPTNDLMPLLKKLKLSGVMQSLDLRIRQAVEDNLANDEFLLRLLSDEAERRDAKQLEKRIRRASFDHGKTIENFDFHFNPGVPKAKILDLATCAFLDRRESVLIVGQTGVGKSHLAQALGYRACLAGYDVLNRTAHEMLTELRAARADGTHERRMLRFTTPDLLVIDDLGLRPLAHEEPVDLYEIIRQRYEQASTIITSNRDPEELQALFGDALLASAAMDRILHHAHVIVIEGESYRTSRRRRQAAAAEAATGEAPAKTTPMATAKAVAK
jgi:DNA replication protein DnaC